MKEKIHPKYKETVIKGCGHIHCEPKCHEAQAKLTWDIAEKAFENERDKFNFWFNKRDEEIKAAEKAGIQKVVDWGNEKCMRHGHAFRHKGELCSSAYRRECTICWQAFLKEVEKC